MLKTLIIENLALIDKAELYFEPGLTVITGETGAGKSVIVNAIGLLLGERADRDSIRFGFDIGRVVGVFATSRLPSDYKKQYAAYIDNDTISVVREVAKSGKSKVLINNLTSTLAELKDITAPFAEILSQHANQQLMNEEMHLDFLDNFAGITGVREDVTEKYARWKKSADLLKQTLQKRDMLKDEQELLKFQKSEIEKASIQPGEEESLIAEKKKLDSSRTLMSTTTFILDVLNADENSTANLLSMIQKELDKIAEIDPELKKHSEELIDISYRLQDLSQHLESYGSNIVDDPERIEDINQRLDELYNLKKKYGGSEEAILETYESIKRTLASNPPDIDSHIDKLQKETEQLFAEYSSAALSLSDTRKKAASYLQKLVVKELAELAIDKSQFKFEFIYEDDPDGVIIDGKAVKPFPYGLESGHILFSANPGEPLKSLVKTASGGEISRVFLALKSAEKKNRQLTNSLLVFDEVDAGIGGQTAIEVGKKLKKLSQDNQLLVITHLHQIAREANHHYVVKKTNDKSKRVIISVNKLDSTGKQRELKRMVALPE